MNEKIKESNIPINVLQALGDLTNGAINYYTLPKTTLEEHKIILNYITNLQEENCKLKETNEEHRKINGDLREENQKLVKVIDELEKSINKEIERTNNLILEDSCMVEINNIRRMLNDDRRCWLYKLTKLKGGNNE